MTERITPGSIRYLGAYHGPARTMYSPTLTLLSLFPPLLTLLTPSKELLVSTQSFRSFSERQPAVMLTCRPMVRLHGCKCCVTLRKFLPLPQFSHLLTAENGNSSIKGLL